MSDLVTIREAVDEDIPTLDAYAYAEGMDAIPAAENVYVAVSDDGDIVGFIRLAFSDEGVCHVNPVVVYPTWRGYGVGRKLTDFALDLYGELRLVSRGTSRAFYEALGFEVIPWEDIHPPIAADCDGCEMYDECNPTPMSKR